MGQSYLLLVVCVLMQTARWVRSSYRQDFHRWWLGHHSDTKFSIFSGVCKECLQQDPSMWASVWRCEEWGSLFALPTWLWQKCNKSEAGCRWHVYDMLYRGAFCSSCYSGWPFALVEGWSLKRTLHLPACCLEVIFVHVLFGRNMKVVLSSINSDMFHKHFLQKKNSCF